MLRFFGIIDNNALEIAEKALAYARGFFDYFAGIIIDNPSKRNINGLIKSPNILHLKVEMSLNVASPKKLAEASTNQIDQTDKQTDRQTDS